MLCYIQYILWGRCVLVVGLPYPNVRSIEMREKLAFLNSCRVAAATAKLTSSSCFSSKSAANATAPITPHDYFESLCLRAVNQSIGTKKMLVLGYLLIV